MQLKEIYHPIIKELNRVETTLAKTVMSGDDVVQDLAQYILKTRGKRLRPALALFSSAVSGKILIDSVCLAAAVELIHSATLVQDDVVDQSKTRRGKPSVAHVFGRNISILFGDYLYSRSFDLLVGLKNFSVLSILIKATNAMAAGEIEQLRLAGKKISKEKYLIIIERKTAGLFSACCEAGAVVAKLPKDTVSALADFGLNFGLAFQIIDDCLDAALPDFYNSVSEAVDEAGRYMDKARKNLSGLPALKQRPFFELCDFVISRAG